MCDNFEFSNFEQDLSGFYLDWFYEKEFTCSYDDFIRQVIFGNVTIQIYGD
jgi:S-formylglutathione hydrolase FrmB